MATMTKERDGYHYLVAQIPEVVWEALANEADAARESIAQTVTRILGKHLRISPAMFPPKKRAGRPPKKRRA